jgi:hypothetical protein
MASSSVVEASLFLVSFLPFDPVVDDDTSVRDEDRAVDGSSRIDSLRSAISSIRFWGMSRSNGTSIQAIDVTGFGVK